MVRIVQQMFRNSRIFFSPQCEWTAEEAENYADPNDRASQESDFTLELRARDRERRGQPARRDGAVDADDGQRLGDTGRGREQRVERHRLSL